MKKKEQTRQDIYESDRGERAYYESKKSLKDRVKLPLTKDGCEALLEMVCGGLELPLDETVRQVFSGYIHHSNQLENSTTLGDIGKVIFNNYAKHGTWLYNQESKDRVNEVEKEKAKLTLAKDAESAQTTVGSETENAVQ